MKKIILLCMFTTVQGWEFVGTPVSPISNTRTASGVFPIENAQTPADTRALRTIGISSETQLIEAENRFQIQPDIELDKPNEFVPYTPMNPRGTAIDYRSYPIEKLYKQ